MKRVLTIERVRSLVHKVRAASPDPEKAHDLEDSAFRTVLSAIALGTCEDPKACAEEVLLTNYIDFPRGCA